MSTRSTEIQAIIHKLLMENGEYRPIELLLTMNCLSYEGYLDWREGRIETLDEGLEEGITEVHAWLDEARSWIGTLDLIPEPVVHHGWKDNAGTILTASTTPALNKLLNTRFRHPREHRQLDLFIDSGVTVALNKMIDALIASDATVARSCLDHLIRIDPDQERQHHASTLICALESPVPEGIEQGNEQLGQMEQKWKPAASALLGGQQRDFLAPLWRSIGKALEPAPFDSDHPGHHASRAYQEGLDWEGVKWSILTVPGYMEESILLVRLAEAHWRLRNRVGAIESWFALCHVAPDQFEQLIDAPGFLDRAMENAWHLAQNHDRGPEITPAWFPAWMLIEEPGLASALALTPRCNNNAPFQAFNTIKTLLAHPQDIELRRTLQALHPGLLAHFLTKWAQTESR